MGDHVYLADYNEGQILHVGSHLACYNGGNWILGWFTQSLTHECKLMAHSLRWENAQ